MGRVGDQVVFRGVDVLVAPSVEVVWAPSRGVKGSIGSYGVRVAGCTSSGCRVEREVEELVVLVVLLLFLFLLVVMIMIRGAVERQVVAVVLGKRLRVTFFDRRGIERQIVVLGCVLWFSSSGCDQRVLSGGTGGDVGAMG